MFKAGRKNTFTEGTMASSAMSSEKRLGQALIMEGGLQSAGEALAGQDARILWISVARTGGMFLKRGPKWGGSEKLGGWDGGELSCYGRFKVINFRHKIVRE